jgi:hypothetical protein
MDFLKKKKIKEKKSVEGQGLRSGDQEVYRAGAFEGDPPTGSFYAPGADGGGGGYVGLSSVTVQFSLFQPEGPARSGVSADSTHPEDIE